MTAAQPTTVGACQAGQLLMQLVLALYLLQVDLSRLSSYLCCDAELSYLVL